MKIYSRRYPTKVEVEEITDSAWTTLASDNKYWIVCTRPSGTDQDITLDSSKAPKNQYVIQNLRPGSAVVGVSCKAGEYINGIEDGYVVINEGETIIASNDGAGKWYVTVMTNATADS